ncbi:MAG: vacuolar protein sorting-associated protein 1 [Watsoniomyces obsoletus]|nr:MAG: vacuolar protein sorting-associated protein 1 [Watsoniomyces obsoletus]
MGDNVVEMEQQQHSRSDHDRNDAMEGVRGPNEGVKRMHDEGDSSLDDNQRIKRRRVDDGRPELERLHAEVGPLYMLCRMPHPPLQPSLTEDLLSRFHLQPLAATVARVDPATGEKRKIRKTYKGKIQAFGLAGRNQEVKHPEGETGGLLEMVQMPEDEWHNQHVIGKELENGLGDDMMAKLERALKMERGPMPGFDASILGLDMPPTSAASTTDPSRKPSQVAIDSTVNKMLPNGTKPLVQQTGTLATTTTMIRGTSGSPGGDPPESARPRRAGKKRRYDDRSFEGYEEAFIDDDSGMDMGLDIPRDLPPNEREDRKGSMMTGVKKRKKNSDQFVGGPSAGGVGKASAMMDRGGNYGVGMVGLGAYGAR